MPPVNIDELNEIMDNDKGLIQECFADFLMDYPGLIAELKAAAHGLDFEKLYNTAHKLKGSLRYLAAEPAARAVREIETAGRNQDPDNLDEKIAAFESQCQKVILFIDEFPS